MKHGGHRDERTYCDSYMPNNAGTDLQGGYFDGKVRSIVNDRFRGLTLHRNPELWQALPARKQYELENSPEFTAIEEEIEALAAKAKTDSAAKDRRNALMRKNGSWFRKSSAGAKSSNRANFWLAPTTRS